MSKIQELSHMDGCEGISVCGYTKYGPQFRSDAQPTQFSGLLCLLLFLAFLFEKIKELNVFKKK